MLVVLIEGFEEHVSAVKYAWTCLLERLGTPCFLRYEQAEEAASALLSFSYGRRLPNITSPRHVHIYADTRLWDNYLRPNSLPSETVRYLELQHDSGRPEFKKIPVVYCADDCGPWVRETRCGERRVLETNADIVSSSFFMLSRYEDILAGRTNDDGFACRLPDWPARVGLKDRPLVDEYRLVLSDWAARLGYEVPRRSDGFGVLLTHDVDWLSKHLTWRLSLRAAGLHAIIYKRPALAVRDLWEAIVVRLGLGEDPYYTAIEWLMDLSEKHGLLSHFFFMAGGKTRHDGFYDVSSPLLKRACEQVLLRGHRIGLHGSYESYRRPEMLAAERAALEKVCRLDICGGRQHFLRFKFPDTWQHYVRAGLRYDSSVGYSGNIGFRCGTARPFVVFDALEKKVLPLIEYPLVVMDVCLTRRAELDAEQIAGEVLRYAETAKRFSGVFTLLWHNSEVWPVAWRAYEMIVAELSRMGAQPMNAAEECEARLDAWRHFGGF